MKTLPQLLEARLTPVVRKLVGDDATVSVVPAADPRFGDYQSNAAMVLAKQVGQPPRQFAQAIVADLPIDDLCESVDIAGPGFLNFTLRNDTVAGHLSEAATDRRLGVPQAEPPRRIVIDYSAPNVAKPMHVGHLRSTVLGSVLDRIARFLGHTVISDNHIGDWGTQFGFVLHGWKTDLNETALNESAIQELVRLYRSMQEKAKADPTLMEVCRKEVVKLQQGDPENLAIWQRLVDLTLEEIGHVYEQLDVSFDHTLGESFYNNQLGPLVDRLIANGSARESEGAICIFFEDHPQLAEKPFLIRKSDGGFLYGTTDLATVEYRITEWNADAIWYVVGAPQQLHFQQLFAAARKIGFQADLAHVAFGSILGADRKLMRTRSGDNVLLDDLLEEAVRRANIIVAEKNPDMPEPQRQEIGRMIGIGAVKYAELSQHRMTDYVFDFDRMLSFQGNTAPYLMNAHVRTRSIFRRLDERGESAFDSADPTLIIAEPEERALALMLIRFSEVVPEVLEDFRPNILANYLYDVAGRFHAFFENCPVLKSEGATRQSRLRLCQLTGDTLRLGLDLLGIQAPERM